MGAIASTAMQNSAARKQQNQQNLFNQQQADTQYQYSEEQQLRQFAFSKEQSALQYKYDTEAMALQRQWDLEDRQHAIDNPTVIKAEVNYQEMVDKAEAAGINPLTALRNGGSAGFSASSQPSAPLSRTAPTMSAPLRHASLRHAPQQGVANTQSPMAAGIGGFLENFDPFADQKRELEFGLVQAQIANLNANTAGVVNRPASFNVPSFTAKAGEQRGSGTAGALSKTSWDRMTSAGVGLSWGVDPKNTPAQEVEDQYAEIPANIVGTANFARDMFNEHMGLSWDSYQLPTLSDWRDGWDKWASYNYQRTRTSGGGGSRGGGGGW